MPPFAISNHRLADVSFEAARWTGGVITPVLVVVHDTASRLTPKAAANYLRDNTRKVSVHLVAERDGTVTQQVPFNRRANHAGRSSYHGRQYCNGFSIGIEIVNPGIMKAGKPGHARAWYGEEFSLADYGIQWARTKEHGGGLWMPYPEAQIAAVEALLEALFGKYDSLIDVQPHWYVSPGRKIDTNPLFPLAQLRARALGREEPAEEAADEAASPVDRTAARVHVPGDTLNMRRWPSFNPNVIAAIPHDSEVPVVKLGVFDGRSWAKVIYAGQEGWVINRYLKPSS